MKILLVFYSIQLLYKASNQVDSLKKSNYLIKWMITEPNLPLIFSVPNHEDFSKDYRWYKYSENVFVDELPTYNEEFIYSNSVNESLLYLLTYDTDTHEQLSSFEPIPNGLSFLPRYLFTIVYLESFSIETIEINDSFNVFCNLTLLLPKNNNTVNDENFRLIEKNSRFKMGLIDNLNERKINIKTENSNQKRDTFKSKFLRVNLDIGPIILPKTNVYSKDNIKNNNVSCMLDLYESSPLEGWSLISRSQLFKAVDTYSSDYKKKEKINERVTTSSNKLSRNSQNSTFFTNNFFLMIIVPMLVLGLFQITKN